MNPFTCPHSRIVLIYLTGHTNKVKICGHCGIYLES